MEEKKEKISKIVITVDLSCGCCFKKIQKVLCKLQEQGENITSISYDEKNTVTVSGPFDPHKLSKKLWCKACKVIKSIEIIPDKQKEQSPPPPPPKKPCEVINDIEIVVCDPPKCPSPPPKPKPSPPKIKPVLCQPVPVWPDCYCKPPKCPIPMPEPKPCPPKPKPIPCPPPVWPDCCYKPCYMECPSCSCGKVDRCMGYHPPSVCCGTSSGGYQLVCEEYPSTPCTMM